MGFGNINRRKQRMVLSSVAQTKNSSIYCSWLWFAMIFTSSSTKWVKFHFLFLVIFLCVTNSSCNDIYRRHHLVCIIKTSVGKIRLYNWKATKIYQIKYTILFAHENTHNLI